ncbi:antirepressor AbbA [Bacillus sp. PS06]|uniref:antirepressor AbbA n=1 Tax=Bacillus sp. PS06 TaxID=2764176 RepID=UPI00177D0DFE|nr:antirepressor AbbA [Bacillus sp. PS06]MBD8068480.1 antirepressor AbbA [Bacillus sp. PS06]
MRGQEQMQLSTEEKDLLVSILFSQNYALELLSCEFVDIENGDKSITSDEYRKFVQLYHKIENAL